MNNATQYAKTLGSIAFANGTPCAPILDAHLRALIADRPIGGSQSEMTAWVDGWMQANLAA